MYKYHFSILVTVLLIWFSTTPASAFMFDRRPIQKTDLSYYFYPFALNIPGIGKAAGMGATITRPFDTEMDLTAIKGKGDFDLSLFIITDIPVITEHITVAPAYINIQDGGIEQYERGRDSDPERKFSLKAHEVDIRGIETSLHLFEDQFEVYYTMSTITVEPKSVIDPDGVEYVSRLEGRVEASAYIKGIYLDDTDNRRDPRVGYRLKYEQWGVLNQDESLGDGYQDDYDFVMFFPIVSQRHILVWDLFQSSATITRPGVINDEDYQCSAEAPPECQVILDQLKAQRQDEVTKGNATSLGGTGRMRAYPQGRFYDTHTFFTALEYRWYLTNGWEPFDHYLFKGVNVSWQLAMFHELGQVSDKKDQTLYKDFKTSSGLGVRVVLSDVVLRADWAAGKEGSQVSVFIGYPF